MREPYFDVVAERATIRRQLREAREEIERLSSGYAAHNAMAMVHEAEAERDEAREERDRYWRERDTLRDRLNAWADAEGIPQGDEAIDGLSRKLSEAQAQVAARDFVIQGLLRQCVSDDHYNGDDSPLALRLAWLVQPSVDGQGWDYAKGEAMLATLQPQTEGSPQADTERRAQGFDSEYGPQGLSWTEPPQADTAPEER